MKKHNLKLKIKPTVKYPSAEMLSLSCYEDYKRLLDTYDKIYEKVNITLAFCGVIMILVLRSFDYTLFFYIVQTTSKIMFFKLLLLLLCSCASVVCMIWSVIQLLLLLRSKSISVFDCMAVKNDQIYRQLPNEAAFWLIDNYTYAASDLRTVIAEKQKHYDSSVIKIVISIFAYAIVLIIEKGV